MCRHFILSSSISRPAEPMLPRDADTDAAWLAASIRFFARRVEPGDPQDAAAWVALLRMLFDAGRCDLPLGRLLEGHVDARQIMQRLGHSPQEDAIYGVWNAEADGWRLTQSGDQIDGGKSYASGIDVLTHSLVTTCAGTTDVQLHVVDLAAAPPEVDRAWWNVRGMSRSRTHRVRWTTARAEAVGEAGDYERPPWFFTGALRFAAVQAGGIGGLRDEVRNTLVANGRSGDAIQERRLSTLHMAAQAAIAVILETGRALTNAPVEQQKALVSNARNSVYAYAEDAIAESARMVGTAAYFDGNPVAERMADLAMYIRQPGPDAQHARVGSAVADGSLDIFY